MEAINKAKELHSKLWNILRDRAIKQDFLTLEELEITGKLFEMLEDIMCGNVSIITSSKKLELISNNMIRERK